MYRKIGGLKYKDVPKLHDTLYFIDLHKYGKLYNIQSPLIKYRLHSLSDSRKSKKVIQLSKKLTKEYYNNGSINGKILELLKNELKNIKHNKKHNYHLLVSKKYLWGNWNPIKTRKHLYSSVKENPLNLQQYILILLTLLPKSIVNLIYKLAK